MSEKCHEGVSKCLKGVGKVSSSFLEAVWYCLKLPSWCVEGVKMFCFHTLFQVKHIKNQNLQNFQICLNNMSKPSGLLKKKVGSKVRCGSHIFVPTRLCNCGKWIVSFYNFHYCFSYHWVLRALTLGDNCTTTNWKAQLDSLSVLDLILYISLFIHCNAIAEICLYSGLFDLWKKGQKLGTEFLFYVFSHPERIRYLSKK